MAEQIFKFQYNYQELLAANWQTIRKRWLWLGAAKYIAIVSIIMIVIMEFGADEHSLGQLLVHAIGGVIIGIAIGLLIGWVVYPTEFANASLSDLSPRFQEEYVLMVAAGYIHDGDVNGAFDRLQRLGAENVPIFVQEITERYISNSRDIQDIRLLVALTEGLGRLTSPMERFCQLCRGER